MTKSILLLLSFLFIFSCSSKKERSPASLLAAATVVKSYEKVSMKPFLVGMESKVGADRSMASVRISIVGEEGLSQSLDENSVLAHELVTRSLIEQPIEEMKSEYGQRQFIQALKEQLNKSNLLARVVRIEIEEMREL